VFLLTGKNKDISDLKGIMEVGSGSNILKVFVLNKENDG
jgi:hypothetical protein